MKGKVLIKAPGELYSPTTGGVLVSADGVRDYRLNKNQEQINQEFEELINNYSGGTSNLQTDNYDITETENHYLRFANRVFNSNIQFGYVYWTPVKKYNIPYFVNLISDEIEVIEGSPSSTILLTGVYYSKSAKRFVAQSKRNNTITYYTEWEAFNSNDEKYQFDSSSVYNAIDLETDSLYYIDENTVCKIRWDDNEHITIVVRRNPSTQLLINAIPYEQLGTIGFNAINVIRHRYNLQGRTIDFSSADDYFILKFEGGSFYNGTIIGSNKVYLDLDGIAPTQDWSVFEGNFANYGTSYPTNPHIGQMFFNVELDKPEFWNGERWTSKSSCEIHKGTTLERPNDLTEEDEGYMYYDTTLHKPIFWNGNYWTDANGLVAAIKYGNVLERPTNLSYPNDVGYTFFDTVDNVLLYWSQDAYGHDVWKDGSGNDYSIIEFTSILNLTATDFNNGQNILNRTWVQQSLNDPKSIYYLGDNLKIFGACRTESSEIPCNFYANWSNNRLFRERDVFEDINSNIPNNITNSISTTPYFKNLENSKLYRYNKRTEKLEEIDLERKTSGTIFDRPTDLTNDMIGYEFYDEIDNVTIYYLGKEKGIDIWKSRSGDVYSIIPFDDEYPTISDSNERSRIQVESESVISTHLVNTVLFCTSYQIFLGYDSGEIFGNWVPKYDNSKILANKYYNNQPVSFTNIENNINKTAYFFNRSNNNYYRYNPSTHLLTILDENLDFVE